MIFYENILPKLENEEAFPEELYMPSKRLLNEILNYELSRHLLKIDDIIRTIQDIDTGRGYLTFQ